MNASSWNYIYWLFGFIWAPAALFWLIDLGQIRSRARALMACSLLMVVMCAPVEYWIVRDALIMRHGHFLGIYYLGIPLEDYLFFFSFPSLMAPLALKLDALFTKESAC